LIELLRVTQDETDLNKDEVNILQGALVLQTKKVIDVMTPISDGFLLPLQTILDFDSISEIKTQGYSRIPVYDGDRTNIVHILLAKDLLFIDPDDNKPLEEICNFYNKKFVWAEKDKPLNQMLNEFKTGEKGHLAIVKEGEDNMAIGIVTLEDIIEEIIQAEIIDEDDIVTDNRSKQKRLKKARYTKEKEVKMFMDPGDKKVEISSQITLAVFQFLSSSVEEFSPTNMRVEVLKKLLTLDVFRTSRGGMTQSGEDYIVKRNVGYDFFLLIIEGKVDVEIGTEGYVFESGSFTCFGKAALAASNDITSMPKAKTWIPDCTIRPKGDVLYFKLRSATYWAAVQASKRGSAEPDEMQKHIQIMIDEQTIPHVEEKPHENNVE
jgi:metal transporter CNNM